MIEAPGSDSFWHLNISTVTTALIMGIAWICARAMDFGSLKRSAKDSEAQQEATKEKADRQDVIIGEMAVAIAKLTTICEGMEYRIRLLESSGKFRRGGL